jgi:conjugation system TraG family ATPase
MSIQLNKRLPILEIDDDCILSKKGEISIVHEIFKPELFSLSAQELVTQHQAWTRAISLLPYGVTLTLQDWYTQASFAANFDADSATQFLTRSSNYHFHERPYLIHRCFCIITFRPTADRKRGNSASSSLLRKSLIPEMILSAAKLVEVKNHCDRFMLFLAANSNIWYRRLTGEELAGTTEQRGLLEQYLQLEPSVKRFLLQDIEPDMKGIRIGKKHTVLYTLADAEQLPSQVSPTARYDPLSNEGLPFPIGFGTSLGPLLPVEHIYSQYLVKDNPAETLKKMETRLRRLKSLGGHSRENVVTHEDISQYLQQAARGDQVPIKAHFNILAWTTDPADVPAMSSKVTRAISRIGATPHLETVGAPQIWWAGLPGNGGDLPSNEIFDTFIEPAVCFFVSESNGLNSKSPFGIRLGDRATGIPLHVDISDEPMSKGTITNRNKFILGGSGSGKSFFTNHLLQSYHDQGAHIVLVDIGGSYKGLCDLLGGKYFAYNEDRPIQFNPFNLPRGDTSDTEKREGLKSLLLTLWKKSDEAFLRSEYVALSNILEAYYQYLGANEDVFACFDSFYTWFRDVYAAILVTNGIREKDFDSANFLYVLRPYYKGGEFDRLLNAQEENDLLQQRFIVFELDRIKDHPILFPIVTIVIMEVFIGKMRRLPGVRKVILLDEAWKAVIAQGEFIKYLYKTVRKYFGEAIVVTQDIEDIVSSPVVKHTIINNADCKILLDQSKFINRFRDIQELLGLTDKDKTMVLSLNKGNDPALRYKEVFIALGAGYSRVYRTEVSLEEYLVYTTEETQKVKVNEYSKRYGSIRHGITRLANDIRSGTVKLSVIAAMVLGTILLPNGGAKAQLIDIAEEVVKEALEQADLKIQHLQTETLYLQNAEKTLENSMAGDLLDDITGWAQQEQELFSGYYKELWQVKSALTTYGKVGQLIERQAQLVAAYQRATTAAQRDTHFSAAELSEMLRVYSGILDASIRNTSQLALVIQSFVTQMDDAGRLRIIDETGAAIDRNYADLQQYTQQNTLLSLQRAKELGDIETVKTLYGIK